MSNKIDYVKSELDEHLAHKVIFLIILLLLLWEIVKSFTCFSEGMQNLNFSGIDTRIYDFRDKKREATPTIFVSGITDYYPPFTKVELTSDGNPYMPVQNARAGYLEQMRKFR